MLCVWCAWSHGVQMLQTVQLTKLPTVAASPPYAASWRTIVYLFLARCALLCTINKGHSFLSIVVFCSVYFVFWLLFLFFSLSLFILFSVVWGYKVSSIRTLFIFFVPFSYLSYFLRIFRLRFLFLISALFFSSLLSSVSNSPTLSRHGNPPVRSTRSLSNKILFHGCITMGNHCSPGFSPLSLVILTWLRTGLKAFLVVTFQQTSLCLLSRILLSL